jgi:hypothetical protein
MAREPFHLPAGEQGPAQEVAVRALPLNRPG